MSRFFEKVIATDLSEKQIGSAIKADNVDYRVSRAEESLDLPGNSVDLITVAQALHWFDLDRFYVEVKRLLKPDGIFATWAYAFHAPIQPEIDAFLNEFCFTTLGPFWKNNNKLIWGEYQDLAFPFLEIATPKITLNVDWSLDDLMGYFKTWSSTQLFIEEHRIDPTSELQQKILPHWGKSTDIKPLKWNLIFRVGKPPNAP